MSKLEADLYLIVIVLVNLQLLNFIDLSPHDMLFLLVNIQYHGFLSCKLMNSFSRGDLLSILNFLCRVVVLKAMFVETWVQRRWKLMVAILVPMKEDQIILAQRSPMRKRSLLTMVCLLRANLYMLYLLYNLLRRTDIRYQSTTRTSSFGTSSNLY